MCAKYSQWMGRKEIPLLPLFPSMGSCEPLSIYSLLSYRRSGSV